MSRGSEKAARLIDIFLFLLLAVAVVWIGFILYYDEYGAIIIPVGLLLGGILSGVICVFLHEIGHVVIGRICGFAFNSVSIGRMRICRINGKLRIIFGKTADSLAGMTEMIPTKTDNLYRRFTWTASGGLMFSLLFLIGSALTFLFCRSIPFAVYVIVCSGVPYAFHLFFFNLLPIDNDNLCTDGAVLFGLLKKNNSALVTVNILEIEGELYHGKTPSEIDRNLYFDVPQLPEDDLNFILLTEYRLMYWIDANNIEEALKMYSRLDDLTEYVPDPYYMDIETELLYCDIVVKKDKDASTCRCIQLQEYLRSGKSAQIYRVCAAYEWYVNGDKAVAMQNIDLARESARTCGIPGVERLEMKLAERILSDMN